jgi:hypothetical protein
VIPQTWDNLKFSERFVLLQHELEKLAPLQAVSDSEHNEVASVVHGLLDIDEAMVAFRGLLASSARNLSALSEEQAVEWLQRLGQELQHILYHISDMRYFRYLIDDAVDRLDGGSPASSAEPDSVP